LINLFPDAESGELLGLRVKDVVFGEQLTTNQVKGKTGEGRIPLVACTSYLAAWLNQHPQRSRPTAFLWPARNESYAAASTPFMHRSVVKMLQTTAKKAGVNKRANPHTFRPLGPRIWLKKAFQY